jgi:hypothetical protein
MNLSNIYKFVRLMARIHSVVAGAVPRSGTSLDERGSVLGLCQKYGSATGARIPSKPYKRSSKELSANLDIYGDERLRYSLSSWLVDRFGVSLSEEILWRYLVDNHE